MPFLNMRVSTMNTAVFLNLFTSLGQQIITGLELTRSLSESLGTVKTKNSWTFATQAVLFELRFIRHYKYL